ncbi:hypothetical protein CHLRE_01g009050v5 [Chlamydomonas reinhardtii]|uniref:Sulfotransferase n=1 Tax=Chlamydomonas reinhardtii TaxID=3055 RepID=A0A2K3E5A8_CHLRE|nr:uncharacterized protein CHLRE_01g009050v5 [Chlamydomonas reinhardtii]PNW87971.1 hypothetical protein CHLRE_01g009050v5 [Chlamydomonas reinhardtii]
MRRSYAAAVTSEPAGPGAAPANAAAPPMAAAAASTAAEPAAEPTHVPTKPAPNPQGHQHQQTAAQKLQVLGAGFGRTGSLSLYVALNALGYKTHHMVEVVNNPDQAPSWYRAGREHGAAGGGAGSKGGRPDERQQQSSAAYWSSPGLLGGYTAAVDWLAAGFLPELLAAHPDIKVGAGPTRLLHAYTHTHTCACMAELFRLFFV